ncbi:cobaltochelatase CobT-related protein [Paraburkholderia phosphatilytica]|uniref:cobaltochelatase CobT-related protein n=1 Tax=Paraburkholderia phosphatilytica TaxID=2282883 RepID=UPI000E4D9137|nr:cobalamin biosynthesis protein CobT [Paraburkholderia phosphatilytica]
MSQRPARPVDFDFESTLGKMARVLTGQYGVAVAFSPDGPRVEPGRIVIPPYDVDRLDDEQARDTLVGYLDLLVARAKYSDNESLGALGGGTAQRLAQVVEDRRVCALLLERYPGARCYIERLREHAARDALSRWNDLSWRDRFVWRVERMLWRETPTVTEAAQSLSAALVATSDVLEHAVQSVSTHDSIRAAHDVIEIVRQLSSRDFNSMMFTVSREDGYDTSSAQSTFDIDDGLHRPPGGDGAGVSSSDAQAAKQSAAEGPGMGHAPDGAPAASDAAPNPVFDESTSGHGSATNRPTLSVPLTTAFDIVTDYTGDGDAQSWHALRTLARAETAPLKAKLERALKADELTHWNVDQERGEIDRRALARLAMSPGYRTPFRVKRQTPGRDAAVTLLIDRSGSMAGRKIELARLCAAALGDALMQLGFDCEVLGYSSIESSDMKRLYEAQRVRGADMRHYNRFTERLDLQVYKRFGASDLRGLARIECGHENPDGEALAWAAMRLADHVADRRILMVLSDGYPATGDGDPAVLRSDLRAKVESIEKAGIEIVGIGILDDAVESFYRNSTVVTKLHELPGIAFSLLGRMLLDRPRVH